MWCTDQSSDIILPAFLLPSSKFTFQSSIHSNRSMESGQASTAARVRFSACDCSLSDHTSPPTPQQYFIPSSIRGSLCDVTRQSAFLFLFPITTIDFSFVSTPLHLSGGKMKCRDNCLVISIPTLPASLFPPIRSPASISWNSVLNLYEARLISPTTMLVACSIQFNDFHRARCSYTHNINDASRTKWQRAEEVVPARILT